MRFLRKMGSFAQKMLNLRLVDRRKRRNTVFLVSTDALSLHRSPITVHYDVNKDMVEYNLHTAAGMRVNNPKDSVRIINPT